MIVPGFAFVQARGDYADKDGMHYGIAIHATANTATDFAEANYAHVRGDGTSAHAYVDRDSLTQALDTDRKAGHAGSSTGNENSIAIEITGLNSWSRDAWMRNVAWAELARWIAYVLTHDPDFRGFEVRRASVAEMMRNPRVQAFYGHDDMRRAWGGTDHTDPGPNFPWDVLLNAVNAAMMPAAAPEGEDSMPEYIGPIAVPVDGSRVNIPLPPVEGGSWPRKVWLNVDNDTDGEVFGVRIAVGNGAGGFAVTRATVRGGHHWSMPLPKGTTLVAVSRQALNASGEPVDPGDEGPEGTMAYAGPISVSLERGPV